MGRCACLRLTCLEGLGSSTCAIRPPCPCWRAGVGTAVCDVHFGTPCSSFSAVRGSSRRKTEHGVLGDEKDPKILNGNAHATAALIHECQKTDTAWSLENPQTSLIWSFPAVRDATADALKVDFDMCQYDGRLPGDVWLYRKATRVMTNVRAFEGLNQRCHGGHAPRRLKSVIGIMNAGHGGPAQARRGNTRQSW